MTEEVKKLIEPIINEMNIQLLSVELKNQGKEVLLEVVIDSAEGIDIDKCVAVTNAINPVLDEADLIDQSYTLEVMSKGVEEHE